MNCIYIPTKGAQDWQQLLAEPDLHWKTGRSAKQLAETWEAANGFPLEVKKAFLRAAAPLSQTQPLIMIPELKVPLPGGKRASQNDLWILGRTDKELVSITVEGKVDEGFDKLISEWLRGDQGGRQERWAFLKRKLQLATEPSLNLRYQLFHRTVSAIITAEEFHAAHAVMIVHSFCPKGSGFSDYEKFLMLFGLKAQRDELQPVLGFSPISLSFLWVSGSNSVAAKLT